MPYTDPFRLAPLDPADLAQPLFALWQAAYAQEAALLGLEPGRHAALRLGLRDLVGGSDTWLGCWQEGELVGALAWGADEDDPAAQRLSALIVAPDWQRRGVATRLLHALRLLVGRGPLVVHLAAANAPALALFEALGWQLQRRWLGPEGLRLLRLKA